MQVVSRSPSIAEWRTSEDDRGRSVPPLRYNRGSRDTRRGVSVPEPVTAPVSARFTALPKPLLAAWVFLAALFIFALIAHTWGGYQAGIAIFALVAAALCFLDERASIVLFIGCSAIDAYGFITHVPFSLSIARVVVVALAAGAALRWLRAKPRPSLSWRALSLWDIGILGLPRRRRPPRSRSRHRSHSPALASCTSPSSSARTSCSPGPHKRQPAATTSRSPP